MQATIRQDNDAGDTPFFARFNSLVHAIAKELKQLKDARDAKPHASRPVAKATIYLAQGTDDVDDQRLALGEYLLQQDFRIVPQGEYSQKEANFEADVSKDLAESKIFVQLLGSHPGKLLLPNKGKRQVGEQHRLALAAGLPTLRWRKRELTPEKVGDPEQANRLAEPDVLALELEEFKAMIVQKVEAILNPPAPPKNPASRSTYNKLVFINADTPDLKLAEQLGKTLEDLGVWVARPYSVERERESTPSDYLAEKLEYCDAFWIVYGGTKGKWVSKQLLLSRKYLALRSSPAAIAVVEMPPKPKDPLDLRVPDLKTLQGQPLPAEEDLLNYFRSL